MNILAIETSCDETSVAIVEFTDNHYQVRSHITLSQIEMHREYGGVFPSMAKREHAKNITPIVEQSLTQAGMHAPGSIEIDTAFIQDILHREPETITALTEVLSNIEKPNLDAIAVTQGPGLEPALWVGINVAKVLGHVWDIPVIPSNHMEGHIVSVLANAEAGTLESPDLHFPALALLISGGHTELVVINAVGDYTKIGKTRDDAVGEAFDKVARLLDLPYPGGPEISRLAQSGNKNDAVSFPRPMIDSPDYDFSFSGLKTAVRYFVQESDELSDEMKTDIAYEFEHAVTDVLLAKTRRAIEEHYIKTLIIAGGVAGNKFIRDSFAELLAKNYSDVSLLLPNKNVTGDNALMMAVVGYFKFTRGNYAEGDFKADGNLSL